MEDKIKYIFENTNNWLNFAEAKNAALLAFNIALIAAISSGDVSPNYSSLQYIIVAILIFSTTISLLSFVPRTNNKISQKTYKYTVGILDMIIEKIFKEKADKNLLFYGYIGEFEIAQADDYLEELKKYYGSKEKEEVTMFEKDLAEEIIINSRITKRKYNYFKASLCILIVGMILLFIVAVLCA